MIQARGGYKLYNVECYSQCSAMTTHLWAPQAQPISIDVKLPVGKKLGGNLQFIIAQ